MSEMECPHRHTDVASCPLCWCRRHAPDYVVMHYEALLGELKKLKKGFGTSHVTTNSKWRKRDG